MRGITALATVLSVVSALGLRPAHVVVELRAPAGFISGAASGCAAAVIAFALGAPTVIVVAVALLAMPVPFTLRNAAVRQTAAREAARWPDFLAAIRSRIATGASLSEATRAAARHLGGRFSELDRRGVESFSASLYRVRFEWAEPMADRVLATLAIAAEIGGRHVDQVLAALASSVADELRLRRAHDAALTQQRLTAGIALVAPWAMLAVSIATNPTALDAYASPTGSKIVLGGLAATVGGFVLARRSARLSEARRVFA